MTNPIALVVRKTLLRNRCSGRIGSAARDSAYTNAAIPPIPITASTTICAESQP